MPVRIDTIGTVQVVANVVIKSRIDGFIDNERFESKRREGCVLSVVRWRSHGDQTIACACVK